MVMVMMAILSPKKPQLYECLACLLEGVLRHRPTRFLCCCTSSALPPPSEAARSGPSPVGWRMHVSYFRKPRLIKERAPERTGQSLLPEPQHAHPAT